MYTLFKDGVLKRDVDYFRAESGTVYKMKCISVATDPVRGPWVTREFIGFMRHGKVRVDMATCGGTPEVADFKFWRFPIITLLEDISKVMPRKPKHNTAAHIISIVVDRTND